MPQGRSLFGPGMRAPCLCGEHGRYEAVAPRTDQEPGTSAVARGKEGGALLFVGECNNTTHAGV